MTTYPHGLTECEKCGSHYCMGCVGEECPNCKLQEVAFYAIELENKLEAVKNILNEATGGEWHIKTINKQSWVKYESAMRYYHAVCSLLEILEVGE